MAKRKFKPGDTVWCIDHHRGEVIRWVPEHKEYVVAVYGDEWRLPEKDMKRNYLPSKRH